MKPIPLSDWGRDHYSLLGYIECRCTDDKGVPDREHLRCNPARHPGLVNRASHLWKDGYSTRLKDHSYETPNQRRDHDDWDCADDLAAAGLIEIKGTGINPVWKLTDLGQRISARLRAHKMDGGTFSTFHA
jgi:hypothetical protein